MSINRTNRRIQGRGINTKRLSYEIVRDEFKIRGYTLLETQYINNKVKMRYLCPIHGEQLIKFNSLQNGVGCAKCAGNKKPSYEEVKELFISRGYVLLEKEYVNSKTKMRYLCPIHGERRITYGSLKDGQGCSKCGDNSTSNKLKLSYEFVKEEFEKRGYKLLDTEYVDTMTPMYYLCSVHGEHLIRYSDLKNGHGCSQCSCSKGETKIQEYLNKHDILYSHEYSFDNLRSQEGGVLRFDFAILDEANEPKALIEYQGIQHYEPIDYFGGKDKLLKQQHHDKYKIDYCKSNGIPLIIIKYTEYDNIDNILDKYFYVNT